MGLQTKAIKELGIKPKVKKGACNYYSRDELAKVKRAVGNSEEAGGINGSAMRGPLHNCSDSIKILLI